MSVNGGPPLTPEELEVVKAVQEMFRVSALCEQAGGDPNRAFLAAVPQEALDEAKAQFPLLGFLGF